MNGKSRISERVLAEMQFFMDNDKGMERVGQPQDMQFIKEGAWLKDAAVIDLIHNQNGAWNVSLVFANYRQPLQLIVRNITRCFSQQKALAAAFYMRKEAAKDNRGTLSVSMQDLDICKN